VSYWASGGHISAENSCKKGGMSHKLKTLHLPIKELTKKLKKAYHCYHTLKNDSQSQDTWIGQLIEAQANTTLWTKKEMWKFGKWLDKSNLLWEN